MYRAFRSEVVCYDLTSLQLIFFWTGGSRSGWQPFCGRQQFSMGRDTENGAHLKIVYHVTKGGHLNSYHVTKGGHLNSYHVTKGVT